MTLRNPGKAALGHILVLILFLFCPRVCSTRPGQRSPKVILAFGPSCVCAVKTGRRPASLVLKYTYRLSLTSRRYLVSLAGYVFRVVRHALLRSAKLSTRYARLCIYELITGLGSWKMTSYSSSTVTAIGSGSTTEPFPMPIHAAA